jgi:hypothetical protein
MFQFTQSVQPHYGPGFDTACSWKSVNYLPVGKGRSERKIDNLTSICVDWLENVGVSTSETLMDLQSTVALTVFTLPILN